MKKSKGKKVLPAKKKPPPSPLTPYQATLYLLHCRSLPPFTRLYSAVIREICSYLTPELFMISPEDFNLRLFDVRNESWLSVPYPENCFLGPNTRFIYLGDGKVFACGGVRKHYVEPIKMPIYTASSFAFILSLQGHIECLPKMKAGRLAPGLAKFSSKVFVFGGCDKVSPSKRKQFCSSEGFNLTKKQWSNLPAMRYGRSDFYPCVWRREVYLCGGGPTAVEVYSPSKSATRELPVSLPEAKVWAVFSRGEELVALSSQFVAVLQYQSGELGLSVEEKSTFEGAEWQSPVVWDGKAFIPQANGYIAVDIATLKVMRQQPVTF